MGLFIQNNGQHYTIKGSEQMSLIVYLLFFFYSLLQGYSSSPWQGFGSVVSRSGFSFFISPASRRFNCAIAFPGFRPYIRKRYQPMHRINLNILSSFFLEKLGMLRNRYLYHNKDDNEYSL